MKLFLVTTTPEQFHIARSIGAAQTACGVVIVDDAKRQEIGARASEMAHWPEWCAQCFAYLARAEQVAKKVEVKA